MTAVVVGSGAWLGLFFIWSGHVLPDEVGRFPVPFGKGENLRSKTEIILRVRIRTPSDEQVQQVSSSFERRQHKKRPTKFISGIRIQASIKASAKPRDIALLDPPVDHLEFTLWKNAHLSLPNVKDEPRPWLARCVPESETDSDFSNRK